MLTRDVVDAAQREEIIERVTALDSADSFEGLLQLLGGTAAASPRHGRTSEARLPAFEA
ncbi:MAG TPA: hypothetical protein VIS03_13465 [Kiloniellaceae bacterium]